MERYQKPHPYHEGIVDRLFQSPDAIRKGSCLGFRVAPELVCLIPVDCQREFAFLNNTNTENNEPFVFHSQAK